MLPHFLLSLEEVLHSSPVLGLGASFLAGIIVSLSPCIYPLIPITLGIVGSAQAASRLKGFYLSSLFVLGMCVTYTVLGIVASLAGIFFSVFFVNPFTYLFLAVLFVVLGLSFMDIIKFNIFFSSPRYSPASGLISIFILGMVSALGLVPCSFPVVGAIMTLLAQKANVVYGGTALFLFALGQGMILLLVGTFTSLIRKLPKSGDWLIIIKKLLGGIIVVVGVYFFFKFLMLFL